MKLSILYGLTFVLFILVAKGAWTYTNKSEFCASCHTMNKEYRNWSHSSHGRWAGCSDCHLPQTNIMTKFALKTRVGIHDTIAYLFSGDQLRIRISNHGENTAMKNCIRCHEVLVSKINKNRKCWECHRGS